MNDTKELESTAERIGWIDFAKGITLLLTIIGHSLSNSIKGCILRGIIFSFHMPLFFILSCMTFKYSRTIDEFKKNTVRAAKHLLIPVIIKFFIGLLMNCYQNPLLISDIDFWKSKLYTLIYSSGGAEIFFNDTKVNLIGMLWFLVALFFGRTIFDYLHLKINDNGILMIFSGIIGMIGVLWGKVQIMPFSLDIALAVMPFFYFGYRLKNLNITINPFRKMIIWGGIWIITLYITFPIASNSTYLELADRRYTLFPLCYLTAIAGTMCVCQFSVICCRLRKIILPMLYLGKNSLYMLFIHALDSQWSQLWMGVNDNNYCIVMKRIVVDITVFVLFMLGKTKIQSFVNKLKL